jgi:CheY-like chemotaxis protein
MMYAFVPLATPMNPDVNKSILIVDDEAEAREALSEFLEAKGYVVECAGNGLEALDEIQSKKPKLILLDLMMPAMDGYTFLDQAMKRHLIEDVPVVITTSYQSRKTPGAAAVVRKPIRPESLMPLIRRFIEDRDKDQNKSQ